MKSATKLAFSVYALTLDGEIVYKENMDKTND